MKVNEVKEKYVVLLNGSPFVVLFREATVACVYDELFELCGRDAVRVVLVKEEDITPRFAESYVDEKHDDNRE